MQPEAAAATGGRGEAVGAVAGAGAAAKLGGNVQTKTPDDLLHGQLPEMHSTAVEKEKERERREGRVLCVSTKCQQRRISINISISHGSTHPTSYSNSVRPLSQIERRQGKAKLRNV